jgi:hypothetical protein
MSFSIAKKMLIVYSKECVCLYKISRAKVDEDFWELKKDEVGLRKTQNITC